MTEQPVNYHRQRRWYVVCRTWKVRAVGLLEELPLFFLLLFLFAFLLLLPADVLTNYFFVKPDGTHTVPARPQVPPPEFSPQVRVLPQRL